MLQKIALLGRKIVGGAQQGDVLESWYQYQGAGISGSIAFDF